NPKKPTILILGTFHMNSRNDMFQSTVDNLLSDSRQQEIREVVDLIKYYNPNKLAVEQVTKAESDLNSAYRNYLNRNLELDLNEVHQIGFRVAAEMNHEKIYAVDWMEQGVSKRGASEVYEWAKLNQPDLFQTIFGWLEKPQKS